MTALWALVSRNCRLFFKNKGILLPSLLAPLILLFLFIAFLGNVYRDSIRSVAEGFALSDGTVESIAAGLLVSSLLAVCAVTIAFTANTIMVQDKVSGQRSDFSVSPVHPSLVSLAYFLSTFLVTTCICALALGAGLIYMAIAGWHLGATDLLLAVLDMLLLTLFGTAFSFTVCSFLHTAGAVTAVQATVSSAYGFLCGAYMPLSSLATGLKNAVMFLPGTYGTGLLRGHLMAGAIDAMTEEGIPSAIADAMKTGFDCRLYFFEHAVPAWVCYLVLGLATAVLFGVCLLLVARTRRR